MWMHRQHPNFAHWRRPLRGLLQGAPSWRVLIEVYYTDWDTYAVSSKKPVNGGDLTQEILISRVLACVDEVECNPRKGRAANGKVVEFFDLTVYGEAIETTEGTFDTEVTIPIDDDSAVSLTVEDGVIVVDSGSWTLRVTPTREPIRYRLQDRINELHQRTADTGEGQDDDQD